MMSVGMAALAIMMVVLRDITGAGVVSFVIQHHPYRPRTNLGCKLVRRRTYTSSTYSEVGALGRPT